MATRRRQRKGRPIEALVAAMPPSEAPGDEVTRAIRKPTPTSFRRWKSKTPEERLRASFALTAFAWQMGEERRAARSGKP